MPLLRHPLAVPLFIDRRDLSGASAADVAAAHRKEPRDASTRLRACSDEDMRPTAATDDELVEQVRQYIT